MKQIHFLLNYKAMFLSLLFLFFSFVARSADDILALPIKCPSERLGKAKTENFPLRFKISKTTLGFARIRKTLVWDVNDLSNVMGKIPSGTMVRANGPLKRSYEDGGSQGIGYAILFRDSDQNLCWGYVSYTVLDRPSLFKVGK